MSSEALDRVRGQIGRCGIWCGSCAVGNGSIADLALRLRSSLTTYDAPQWISLRTPWESFLGDLASLETSVACVGCLRGGGRTPCEMQTCAPQKGVTSCTVCASFPACEHAEILQHMRSGAVDAGLTVLVPGEDPIDMIRRGTPGA